jgi:hypothetical protein
MFSRVCQKEIDMSPIQFSGRWVLQHNGDSIRDMDTIQQNNAEVNAIHDVAKAEGLRDLDLGYPEVKVGTQDLFLTSGEDNIAFNETIEREHKKYENKSQYSWGKRLQEIWKDFFKDAPAYEVDIEDRGHWGFSPSLCPPCTTPDTAD